MNWEKVGATAMRSAPWTVAKVFVRGICLYELWHDKLPERVGRFASFDLAKREAQRFDLGGQA